MFSGLAQHVLQKIHDKEINPIEGKNGVRIGLN